MPKIVTVTVLAMILASALLDMVPALAVLVLPPLTATAALIAYRRTLTHRPYTRCRPCRGTGYRYSLLFARSDGCCPTCHGAGHRPRPGARLLNIR